MLYVLKNINDGSVFYLVNQEKFIIGRKDCDLIIQNDSSISRKHASIDIKNDIISVTDLGSKYKTFYKGKELDPNVETLLKIDDEIQFGVMTSLYKLKHYSYVTTSTRLTDSDKVKLNKNLAVIGGKYVDTWTTECTHLTSKEMNLTVKVLHALLDQKFIVTPTFWSKFVENISKNLPFPNESDFNNLEITEPLLNKADLSINPVRKKIFNGKIFLFLKEKNKKQMEEIIHKAGGIVKSWEKNPMPIKDITKSPKNFLIIQVPFQEENESFNELIKAFSKIEKRTIPMSEIAIAILMCDTTRFCNPTFKLTEEVFSTKPTRLPTQNPLAQDTQSEYFVIPCKREENSQFVIPDTLDNPMDVTTKLSQDKKSKQMENPIEKNSNNTNVINKSITKEQSTKRDNSEETSGNPFKKMKLEREDKISEKQQQKVDGYFSKNTSDKRKNEDIIENEESPNRNEDNPFASIKKKMKTEAGTSKDINPFALIKKQDNSHSISEDNSFKTFTKTMENKNTNVKNKKANLNKNEWSKNEISNTRSDYSRQNPSLKIVREKNWEWNNTWYSKNTHAETKSIKKEQEFDSEIQHYIDMFRDKIVIDVLKVAVRDVNKTCDVTDGSLGEVKNFKKFKKVKSLKTTTTIISRNDFIEMLPENTASIVDNRKKDYNSDEEIKVKKGPKKFVL